MISLNHRVSITAAVVVAVFVALTALALDRAFQQSAEAAVSERLTAQLYLLMADAELSPAGQLLMPKQMTEPRLTLPGSGLYAEIRKRNPVPVWRSPSALGIELNLPQDPLHEQFYRLDIDGHSYFTLSMAIEWESNGHTHPLRFSLFEDLGSYHAELAEYRHSLWGWLGAMGLLLLIAQAVALAWGLRPLRTVAGELEQIEAGRQCSIERDYPKELQRLTRNINTLLHHERAQQSRYRDALADLAHSLKTPLAVLRGLTSEPQSETTLQEQVARMDEIVGHQLQRASTAGRSALATPLPVAPLIDRLLNTLQKVYHEKGVTVERQLKADAQFRGDEGDLMELLGNLLDNAFKWSQSTVSISARCLGDQIELRVEDDGPGIPEALSEQILQRGARLDEATPGHGIGLAMVDDIVDAYEGQLSFERSEKGGAAISVQLPGCDA